MVGPRRAGVGSLVATSSRPGYDGIWTVWREEGRELCWDEGRELGREESEVRLSDSDSGMKDSSGA